jgi:SAM-dependent methyltransferase
MLYAQARSYLPAGAQIVDLGCGEAPYRATLTALGFKYFGADLGGDAELLIDGSGRVSLPTASVDAILSIQVLEHVPDLAAYLGEARRLLVDDGWLLLSTHGTWLYHPHPEDHRRWTRPGLIAELRRHGFDTEECQPIAGPLATTTIIRLTGYVYILKKIPLVGWFLARFLACLMNWRAVLEDRVTPKSVREDNACVYLIRARKCPL